MFLCLPSWTPKSMAMGRSKCANASIGTRLRRSIVKAVEMCVCPLRRHDCLIMAFIPLLCCFKQQSDRNRSYWQYSDKTCFSSRYSASAFSKETTWARSRLLFREPSKSWLSTQQPAIFVSQPLVSHGRWRNGCVPLTCHEERHQEPEPTTKASNSRSETCGINSFWWHTSMPR